jgi:hypothetical protein
MSEWRDLILDTPVVWTARDADTFIVYTRMTLAIRHRWITVKFWKRTLYSVVTQLSN